MWINYEEDLNCTLVAVKKHGAMTLREIARREKISFVRVKQIQDKAMEKIRKFSILNSV
jgi:DNA-directed RNA polymerase sigma subunit (sigma70/sigma32)